MGESIPSRLGPMKSMTLFFGLSERRNGKDKLVIVLSVLLWSQSEIK
jgi:hypothetical protein